MSRFRQSDALPDKMKSSLAFVLLLVSSLPALKIELEESSHLHFREIGVLAGSAGMGHLVLRVNVSEHRHLVENLCRLPKEWMPGTAVSESQKRLLADLGIHCRTLLSELDEREEIWSNDFSRHGLVTMVEGDDRVPILRQKRGAFLNVLGGLGGVAAVVSTLYTYHELATLSDGQQRNTRELSRASTRLAMNARSIGILNRTLTEFAGRVRSNTVQRGVDEVILHSFLTLNVVIDETTRVIRGLNMLAQRRLSPDLVQVSSLAESLTQLKSLMQQDGFELGIESLEDVFMCETSHILLSSGELIVFLHLPALRQRSVLRIYEHLAVPLVVPGSTDDHALTLFADTSERFLAVTEDERTFIEMGRDDLDRCQHFGSTFFCKGSNVYDRRPASSCLLGLYKREAAMIQKACKWRIVVSEDFAVQVTNSTFLVYQARSSLVKLKCGIESSEVTFQGLRRVGVPSGCQLYTPSFELDGAGNFGVDLKGFKEHWFNYSSMWDWSLLAETKADSNWLSDLALVGSMEGLSLPEMSDLHHTSHLTRYWGWVITLGVLLLIVGLGLVVYKVYWKQGSLMEMGWCQLARCNTETVEDGMSQPISPVKLTDAIKAAILEHLCELWIGVPPKVTLSEDSAV
jgi:hypothetical protein